MKGKEINGKTTVSCYNLFIFGFENRMKGCIQHVLTVAVLIKGRKHVYILLCTLDVVLVSDIVGGCQLFWYPWINDNQTKGLKTC